MKHLLQQCIECHLLQGNHQHYIPCLRCLPFRLMQLEQSDSELNLWFVLNHYYYYYKRVYLIKEYTFYNNDLTQTNGKIEEIQSHLSDTFIKKMKLLGRSSNSNVVKLNESFKNYDAIYVSFFTKDNVDHTKISTSIFVFSEDINVGDKITLVEESAYDRWYKSFLTISSNTSFSINNKQYTTIIGINL